MNDGYILALDLGGTKLASALFSREGLRIHSEVLPIGDRTGKLVGQAIISCIDHYCTEAELLGRRIESVGIAVPGIYNRSEGSVWAPNIPGWDFYPLLQEVAAYFGDLDIHISIDSDRACYILGEYWQGAATGCRHAIYLAVGTGIGAGILIDGKVLRGSQDIAGAIGWMALRHDYLAPYKTYGCFEYHASGQGIFLNATDHFQSTAEVFQAFDEGIPEAVALVNEAILCWGQATANLVSLFNPEIIVFGGGVFGPARKLIDKIYEEASRWAQPISIKHVRFVPTHLGELVALYGAAYLAMEK